MKSQPTGHRYDLWNINSGRKYDEHFGERVEIMTVRYEELVASLKATMRRVLLFLDLDPNDSGIANPELFWRQQDASKISRNPSSDQVVKPLYSTSIGRYNYYSLNLLRPLLEELQGSFACHNPSYPDQINVSAGDLCRSENRDRETSEIISGDAGANIDPMYCTGCEYKCPALFTSDIIAHSQELIQDQIRDRLYEAPRKMLP